MKVVLPQTYDPPPSGAQLAAHPAVAAPIELDLS
jgi:hypothetical protein